MLYIKSIKTSSKSNAWSKIMINIVSEPDVPIGFLDYYNHDKSNKTLLPGL